MSPPTKPSNINANDKSLNTELVLDRGKLHNNTVIRLVSNKIEATSIKYPSGNIRQ